MKEELTPDYTETDAEYLSHLKVPDHASYHFSGGEATRLVIVKLFTDPSNILVLDEPTNFIADIETIQATENLMKSYEGTILFTSLEVYSLWTADNYDK